MRCHSCGDEAPEGKRFCPNCGTALAAPCASCGADLAPGQKFCGDCGASSTAMPTTPTAARPAEPSAERRLCSVLFVDLVSFTGFAEKRDPEEVRELLSRYFDTAQAIVQNYGGTVEKFIGDAVMAVWGAPTANEDDAERAVRAGLDVVVAVGELGRSTGHETLSARGGIVTGPVAITVGKVSEGMVLGDTVNSASRLQGLAEPGTVIVDEATWRASSDAIVFDEIGVLTLKGREESLRAWRAVRVVGKRKGLGRSDRPEPPFVGRDDEIRLVKDLLHATARERRARLVSVTGVPGIGKSRLAWEFLKYVDGVAEDVFWHQGRSASYGEGVTFGALGEMIRMRAGINEADGATESRRKLSASVAEFVPEESERRWIESHLAHLLGLAEAPSGDRNETFSAWRTFFERISSIGLTVMVFEDLQWADPGLIDFIESILEWSRSYPIMVVTLSRPELLDLRPDWGAGQRSFTSLHLEPLTDSAMRALLEGYVSGLPETVTASVLSRAQGVPLYAVETVRMMVDRGVLRLVDGTYVIEGEMGDLDVPESLHALVTSRLDALPVEQRAILQDAAVLGTTFSPDTLGVVGGVERSSLDGHLRDLVRREFLYFDTDPRSPERGQYGFVQGVIGDVALSMLSRRDLSAKHLVAARHYESLGDDELVTVVASHYAAAHRAAPDGDHAEATAEKARTWLGRAGERALSLGSPERGLDLFEQALLITPSGPERARLLSRACDAALAKGDLERALGLVEDAVSEFETVGDITSAARATSKRVACLSSLDRVQEASDVAIAAYETLGEDGDLTARAELAQAAASAMTHGTNSEAALSWAEVALTFSERLDNPILFLRSLNTRSFALFNLGRHQEAVMLARGCMPLAVEAGSLREQTEVTLSLSLYSLSDDPHESFVVALESAEIARRAGQRGFELTNLLNAAETAISLGRWSESREILAELDTRVLAPRLQNWAHLLRAVLDANLADYSAAQAQLTAAALGMGSEFVAGQTTMLHATAQVHYAAGDFQAAHEIAASAVALDPMGINSSVSIALQARAAIARRDVGEVYEALAAANRLRGRWIGALRVEVQAALAALEGRTDEAWQLYASAVEAWRSLNCVLDMALTELEQALLLGRDDPLAENAKEAEDIFTELGAVPLLERLRAAIE